MKLHGRLLQFFGRSDYAPLTRSAIAAALDLPKSELRRLDAELQLLVSRGTVTRNRANRYCRPGEPDLATGTIYLRASGKGYLQPELPEGSPSAAPPPEPVEIDSEDTATAFHGDRVIVRIFSKNAGHRASSSVHGRVVRVISRGRETITGTLRGSQRSHYVSPDDPRFSRDIGVGDPANSPLTPAPAIGDKVVVRLDDWDDPRTAPKGEIIAVLGRALEPRAELAAIFHKYKLETAFPHGVEAEAAALPTEVLPAEIGHRLDLRQVPTCTIDPDDAKDFDDALSLEPLPDGGWRVGVHIADVGSYVRPGTALDTEARRRGNSTYLVGTVIPMLPFKLSNGLCSLVEGKDRLTLSTIFTFDNRGRVVRTEFAQSVICSRKRLTYRQAHALIHEDDLAAIRRLPLPPAHQTGATGRPLSSLPRAELGELQSMVRTLWQIAGPLRAERFGQGALDLDMPETKIFVDAEGYADRLERIEHDESHQLVEEFMLLANEAVARVTRRHKLPSVYRVHDDPAEAGLHELREFLATQGIRAGDLTARSELTRVLGRIREHPQSQFLRVQLLRRLARACYREQPDGHFGLAKRDYTHFTSPIRRYADLVVHRVLVGHISSRSGRLGDPGRAAGRVEGMRQIAEHLSLAEQNSTEAERESVKVKMLEYYERELKKRKRTKLPATILEVRKHGLFVEVIESQAYGFLPVSGLGNDLYSPTPDSAALVGRRSRRRFGLGDTIDVEVAAVDRNKRQIDFRLAGVSS